MSQIFKGLRQYTWIQVFLQLFTGCFVFWLHYKNKQIFEQFVLTTVRQNLQQRFAIWSNVKICAWLIPCTISSASVTLLTMMTVLARVTLAPPSEVFDAVRITGIYNMIICLEIFLFPICVIR